MRELQGAAARATRRLLRVLLVWIGEVPAGSSTPRRGAVLRLTVTATKLPRFRARLAGLHLPQNEPELLKGAKPFCEGVFWSEVIP